MKKNMKKFLAMVLAVMSVVSLAACTEKTANESDVPTLVWYVPGDKPAALQTVLDEANKIIEPEIGARLDLRFIDQSSYTERMQMMMASRNEFDLMLTGYVNPFQSAYDKGGLLDITEYVEKDEEFKAILPDYAWKAASFDNKIYAVPNEQIWAAPQHLGLRKDLVEKYGFDASKVKTMRDAEEFFELVKKNDPTVFPIYISNGHFLDDFNRYEVITTGAQLDRRTNEVVAYWLTDDFETYGRLTSSWYDKGYIRSDIATVENQLVDWRAGRYAAYIFGWKPGIELVQKADTGHEWVNIPMGNPYITRSSINATMTAVSKTSKNPDKGIELIKLMNKNIELYRLITHGIEGVHYEKVSDIVIKPNLESGYYLGDAGWKFGNQYNAYVTEGQSEDVWSQTKELNESADVSPLIGFSLDTTPFVTEVSQVLTVSERYKIVEGIIDVDSEWKKMQDDYKKAGVETIVEEVKTQVNEYFANNQ